MAVEMSVRAYPPLWRWVVVVLFAVSRGMLPVLLWRVVTANDPPITPPMLADLLLVFWALPGAAAWLIGRAFTARARVDASGLTLERGSQRVSLARREITALRTWRLPLPEAGCTLALAGGARRTLAARDPAPLVAALGGDVGEPTWRFAKARARQRRDWLYWLRRYVLVAVVPAAILFNAHQYIAYGGTLGQYYLQGLAPWLRGAAIYWATVSAYLLLWASLWRGLVEATALAAAHLAPRDAVATRRVLERLDQLAFYGGTAAILALRFSN